MMDQQQTAKKRNKFLEVMTRLLRNKTATAGLIVILIIAALAFSAPLICDYDEMAIQQHPELRLQPPSSEHLLGTDHLGRDIFARLLYGARTSLSVGIIVVLISASLGGFIGSLSAVMGGRIDNIIMRIVDIFTCIPAMLLTLAMVSALGHGISNLVIAMCINYTFGFIRVVRSAVLSVVSQDFVEAARSYGTRMVTMIFKHIMPNAMGIIIVQATMSVAGVILGIAGLSFLGMGIEAPSPEWGAMLNEGRAYMRTFPYLIMFPGIAIVVSALSLNLVGDGLRDALDPKLRD